MSSIKPTTCPDKRLSESITGASTSFKINSITGWDDVDLTSADFGSKLYAVFRNSTGTEMEIMSIDPTTITSASSAITILLRGLKFDGDLTTEVSGNKKTWVKGDTIVSLGTHVPQLLKSFVDIYGAQTIEGLKTFSTMPQSSAVPASGADLINKTYADALVLGVLTTINVIVPGKAGENVSAGQSVYFDLTDNEWKLTDADTAATVNGVQLGIAQGTGTNGVAITGGVLLQGVDTHQSGLVEGDVQYVGNTAGAISTTPGTTEVTVGIAKSATELYFSPRFDQQITEDQQDAMGGTSGTPSASNKFVTADDVSASATADKIVRRDGSGLIAGAVTTKFGGTGADGALALTSGATNIDLGGLAVVTKNYTSISITGTGSLTFTNPHANGTIIILKSQGNVTLTSSVAPMIDASGMGAAASTASVSLGEVAGVQGGVGGVGSTVVSTDGAAGTAGSIYTSLSLELYSNTSSKLEKKFIGIYAGSGGRSGGNGAGGGTIGVGGAGGRGGGGLYIECAGAWNFTTASGISVAGANGVNGTDGVSTAAGKGATGGGGGSGGRAGMFLALYATLTANSGTINISSGAGGNGGARQTGSSLGGVTYSGGGGGGTAGFIPSAGTAGGLSQNQVTPGGSGSNGSGGAAAGASGSSQSGGGGTGGTADTSSGTSLIAQNVWFV